MNAAILQAVLPRGVLPALALLAALTVACSSSDGASQADTVTTSVEPFSPSISLPVALPTGYRIEVLLEGLENPTSVAATPDGRLLIAEQETGRVRIVADGELLDEPWYELDVFVAPDVFIQELGLVSIAVDPLFEENGFVYVYYTVTENGEYRTVLSRIREDDGRGGELTELLEVDFPPWQIHIAGGITFDPSGALLVGVGDHQRPGQAPRLDTLVGKVLRIDRDGNPLPDNPLVDREDADPRVYAYGLRNPYGLAVDSETGQAYITENRTLAGDAVYELEAGADYGWPQHAAALREPLLIYEDPMGLAAITVYNDDVLAEFTGDLFFCTFHGGGALHWARPYTDDVFERDRTIAIACTTGITVGADGFLYFLSYVDGKLLRISR